MITNLTSILKEAKINKYAIGSFNVYNYETIRGVIDAAKEMDSPVIIAFGEKYLVNMEPIEVVNLVKTMSKDLATSVVIHLDHCKSVEVIRKAIDAGFTSVMIDASHLSLADNIKITSEVVEYAHNRNVSVEAELGSLSLGEHSNEDEGETIYTDPLQAKEFVLKTNVDALAVSIGTVHGMYKGEPVVSVERLKEIKEQIDVPFVLHGGSGTPEQTVKECINQGITKINVNTEISVNVVKGLKEAIANNSKIHYSNLSQVAIGKTKEIVSKYIKLFNNN